jgi:hypothetical protein
MKRIAIPVIVALACVLASAHMADAQTSATRQMMGMGTIDGVVTDTMLVPLTGSTVSILGTTVRVVTGENGRFRIAALQPGQYIVIAHRLGYEPLSARVNVTVTDTERVSFALERVVSALDTVKVAGAQIPSRFAEFESRLKNKAATAAFTREDILKVNPVDTWQMLSRVPALKLVPAGANGGWWPVSTRAMRVSAAGATPCFMSVMVDGVVMAGDPPAHNPKQAVSGDPTFNDAPGGTFDLTNLPPPDQIHGIEVFGGPASIPPQYNGAGNAKMCGLIVIWTR